MNYDRFANIRTKMHSLLFQLQFAQQINEDVILFLVMNNSYDKLKYFTLFALSYKLKPVLPGEVAKGGGIE